MQWFGEELVKNFGHARRVSARKFNQLRSLRRDMFVRARARNGHGVFKMLEGSNQPPCLRQRLTGMFPKIGDLTMSARSDVHGRPVEASQGQ